MSLVLEAYRAATGLFEPLTPMLLRRRAARGKEDPGRLEERLGYACLGRPPGPLVWMHGASVGETLSAIPLIERIGRERPDASVLVTSGTVASAELLGRALPDFAMHQYAPVDGPRAAARFMDHWRPDVLVLVEGELWPNLILEAKARGCRIALVSARFTERTAAGWGRAPAAARRLLSGFDLILPQDEGSARRLEALGALTQGRANLKLSGGVLEHDRGEFERLSAGIGDRAVVVSASTHEGEEALVDAAVRGLAGRPLHLIAPRHPARAAAIEDRLSREGRSVGRRSRGDPLAPDLDVYLADTLGEMGLVFRLADVVVLGGGWAPGVGGHNPLEPARLGKAVVSGPGVSNWPDVFAQMAAQDAVRLVAQADLGETLGGLLTDPQAASDMGRRAQEFARREGGVLDQAWSRLEGLIPR